MRCINSPLATRAIHNRADMMSLLSREGLPVPETTTVSTWDGVVETVAKRPAAIKSVDGSAGRGTGVLLAPDGNLPQTRPFDGPFVAQEYIPSYATVRKIYVVGRHTRGLIKSAGITEQPENLIVPFDVDEQVSDLARRAGTALGIEIYGVDILYGMTGPVIIDVNPFPGFRDVPDARPG